MRVRYPPDRSAHVGGATTGCRLSPRAMFYCLGLTTSFVLSTTLFVTCLPRRPTLAPTRLPRRLTVLLLATTFSPTSWLFSATVLLLSTILSLVLMAACLIRRRR